MTCSLADLPLQTNATIERIDGRRTWRLRLLELGLVPGTEIRVVQVAPMGDPLELSVRGARLSIRASEAAAIQVSR